MTDRWNGIRSCVTYGLILFIFVSLSGCFSKPQNDPIRIRWKGTSAEGVAISRDLTPGLSPDSVASLLTIRLIGSNTPAAILGDYSVEPQTISFTPLVPFTRGLQYEIVLRNKRIGTFDIPLADFTDAPKLLAIFPSQDTLPENLLKMYFHFSQPMQEGKSADNIFLIRNQTDTVKGAFLNLQPELWNEDRTVLTLWLDPGRIKRDLHPNQLLGAPLQKGGQYRVVVSSAWKDQQGSALPDTYSKSFAVTDRDSLSPVPENWKILSPEVGTTQPIRIGFAESLDHSLVGETLSILDANGKRIEGRWEGQEEEKMAYFKPSVPWQAGKYRLRALTVLEDLAGNNLNRPFDRDVTKERTEVRSEEFVEVPFLIGR